MIEDRGTTVAVVTHAPIIRHSNRAVEATAFCAWLREATMTVFVAFAVPADLDHWAETILSLENSRGNFSPTMRRTYLLRPIYMPNNWCVHG